MLQQPLVLVLVVIAAVGGLYILTQYVSFEENAQAATLPCGEITDQELGEIVGNYLGKESYENFSIRTVSPVYCSNGVGLRNIVVDVVVDKGLPTQHNKILRLQLRTDANETKIYEVVLTKPA